MPPCGAQPLRLCFVFVAILRLASTYRDPSPPANPPSPVPSAVHNPNGVLTVHNQGEDPYFTTPHQPAKDQGDRGHGCDSLKDMYNTMKQHDRHLQFLVQCFVAIAFFLGVVLTSNYLGRVAKPRPPSYWKNRPCNMFSDTFYEEVDVTEELRDTMQELLDVTTKRDCMGRGRDGAWATHKGFKVARVSRIENGELWTKYVQSRSLVKPVKQTLAAMSGKLRERTETALETISQVHSERHSNNGTVESFVGSLGLDDQRNERLFFHASPQAGARNAKGEVLFQNEEASPLHAIKTTGFDDRLGSVKGMYGSGIYFADMASKADQYGGKYKPLGEGSVGENAAMFVSRVTLGCPYPTEQSLELLRRPPCLEGHFDMALRFSDETLIGKSWRDKGLQFQVCNHSRFDSVMAGLEIDGKTKLYREFVVYDQQAYPEFCIYYVRTE